MCLSQRQRARNGPLIMNPVLFRFNFRLLLMGVELGIFLYVIICVWIFFSTQQNPGQYYPLLVVVASVINLNLEWGKFWSDKPGKRKLTIGKACCLLGVVLFSCAIVCILYIFSGQLWFGSIRADLMILYSLLLAIFVIRCCNKILCNYKEKSLPVHPLSDSPPNSGA